MEVVDVQFLAGVAVTVFLALLFFGVVVLWDVALALRSVGDKIDKLEDNVDDDLKDIGHSIDGISMQPGGGTQLHLGGGANISSTPPSGQQAPYGEQPPTHAQAGAQAHPDQRSPANAAAHPHGMGQDGADLDDPSASVPSSTDEAPKDADGPTEASASDLEGEDETDPAADEDLSSTDPGDEPEEADEPREHPRAARSRGRFITSPDRTPWYAVSIDPDAVATGPTIAGELEAGDRETDATSDPEPIVIGPPEDEPEPDPEPIAVGPAPGATVSSPVAEEEVGSNADDADEEAPASGAADDSDDATNEDAGVLEEIAADSERDGDEERAETAADDADDPDTAVAAGADVDAAGSDLAGPSEDDDSIAVRTDDSSDLEGPERGESGELAAGEARGLGTAEEAKRAADEKSSESDADETTGAEEANPDADDPDSLEELDFDAFGDADPELTVDEAVDEMNEDAPATALSGHGFDVTAEADDDGAVLIFEIDPDTVDVSGSTKRLLKYQLRSFADRESTPDGDVSIDGNVIVVELPDADGTAISTWGEATVAIIDRTLYLSDSSP